MSTIAFPAEKLTSKVRQVAYFLPKLVGKTYQGMDGAEFFWTKFTHDRVAEMRAAKIPEPEILKQLQAFASAVNREMEAISSKGNSK